jgi:hypothetical protein
MTKVILIATAALLLTPLGAWAADEKPASALPALSWQRVPVYAHLGKNEDDFAPQELEFLATHFDFIAIEKGQAVRKRGGSGGTEDGIYEAARQLKKLNPRASVLFYWNAFLDYPLYNAAKSVEPDWHLKTPAGQPFLVRNTVPAYDLSRPAVREWWSDVAARAMREAPLDGIFADALPQVLTPAKARQFGDAKHRAMIAGLKEMMAATRRKLGPGKIILANGTRAEDFRELLDWDSLSGVMIEHFMHFGSASKEDMASDLRTIELAGRKGKLVVVKGWPGFTWMDKEMMQRPHAELAKLAAERLTFPLACFLVAAQPRSYFCYSWGYRHDQGALDWYPEFDKPLGPPRGDAKRDGWKFTREFERASVFVDLERRVARIEWR